jgi:hypothetical protein
VDKKRGEIKGKLATAIDMLLILCQENKEDSKEIKFKVQETQNEIADID